MDRHSRSSREITEYTKADTRTNDKDRIHKKPKPNEIEPLSINKESSSKSSRHDSKDGKRETKSVHSIFALPTNPSTKSSPHKSPKQSFSVGRKSKLLFERVSPSYIPDKTNSKDAKPNDGSIRSSLLLKDSPVVGYIDKAPQEKHSKRFGLSSQSRKLDFDVAPPKPRAGSTLSLSGSGGSGGGDDEAKKRKLAAAKNDLVVIEDDVSPGSKSGKKQREN